MSNLFSGVEPLLESSEAVADMTAAPEGLAAVRAVPKLGLPRCNIRWNAGHVRSAEERHIAVDAAGKGEPFLIERELAGDLANLVGQMFDQDQDNVGSCEQIVGQVGVEVGIAGEEHSAFGNGLFQQRPPPVVAVTNAVITEQA